MKTGSDYMVEEKKYTPMMMQYLEVKKQHLDAIVFYRLGDFYEMFFDDAKTASQELDLVLTGRNAGVEERVPMCGIPYHAANGYIQRLVQKGSDRRTVRKSCGNKRYRQKRCYSHRNAGDDHGRDRK